jgi:hypothetical protein
MIKVIIAGGRDFGNSDILFKNCDEILKEYKDIEIVSGTANGADKMGEYYARQKGYQVKKFPAQWEKYGKSSGYIRNKEMSEYGDILIAFWDGSSKGTKNMIELAESKNIQTHVILY